MLIWRGNGLAVPIVSFGSLLAMDFVTSKVSGPGYYAAHVWPKLLGFSIAAVVVFFVARATEESGRDGDHFFFVPIKAWTYILLIGGVILSFTLTVDAPNAEASRKEEPKAAPAQTPEPAASPSSSTLYQPTRAESKPRVSATENSEPETIPHFEQVYVDAVSMTYFPENCGAKPPNAVHVAKSAAIRQGYLLSSRCSDSSRVSPK